MTIPKIEAYALPVEAEVPSSQASWSLQPSRAALLIHDLQEYFLDFYDREQAPVKPMLEKVLALKRACEEAGVPIVYTAQPPVQSPSERALLQDMWGPGITARPERSSIEPLVAPGATDTVITKWRYSAFARTSLSEWLAERGRDQLIICGVYAHIGCQTTALDAFMADVEPFLVADAVADFSRERHDSAVAYVAGCCGVATTTKWLERALEAPPISALQPTLAGCFFRDAIREEIALLLEVSESSLSDSLSLIDQGLDSIRLMMVVERLNDLGVQANFVDFAESPTLAAWYELVEAAEQRSA